MIKIFLTALGVLAGCFVFSFSEEPPRRKDDVSQNERMFVASPRYSPVADLFGAAVRFYQNNLSVHSSDRCPFGTSCSNFCLEAVEKNGAFVGLLTFMDRYYYRENASVIYVYGLMDKDGVLKADDSFFVK